MTERSAVTCFTWQLQWSSVHWHNHCQNRRGSKMAPWWDLCNGLRERGHICSPVVNPRSLHHISLLFSVRLQYLGDRTPLGKGHPIFGNLLLPIFIFSDLSTHPPAGWRFLRHVLLHCRRSSKLNMASSFWENNWCCQNVGNFKMMVLFRRFILPTAIISSTRSSLRYYPSACGTQCFSYFHSSHTTAPQQSHQITTIWSMQLRATHAIHMTHNKRNNQTNNAVEVPRKCDNI